MFDLQLETPPENNKAGVPWRQTRQRAIQGVLVEILLTASNGRCFLQTGVDSGKEIVLDSSLASVVG